MNDNLTAQESLDIFNKTKIKYEIERKFILKNVPDEFLKSSKKIELVSFYLSNDDSEVSNRIRLEKTANDVQIIQTTKTPTGINGTRQELEAALTCDEFFKMIPNITHYIKKTRYVKYVDGYKWEIDDFDTIKLIMAEVEMIAENLSTTKELQSEVFKLQLPAVIKNHLIYEVTNIINFDNKKLAIKNVNDVENLYKSLLYT